MPYKDPEKQRAYQNKWKRERVDRLRDLKREPCMDCGGTFHPAAMQWDHRPGEAKFRHLSGMTQYNFERITDEIQKCDLVCANCHAVRTYNRRVYLN
jgi:hypothetical protein